MFALPLKRAALQVFELFEYFHQDDKVLVYDASKSKLLYMGLAYVENYFK